MSFFSGIMDLTFIMQINRSFLVSPVFELLMKMEV